VDQIHTISIVAEAVREFPASVCEPHKEPAASETGGGARYHEREVAGNFPGSRSGVKRAFGALGFRSQSSKDALQLTLRSDGSHSRRSVSAGS
jgi:hypothetical protein